MAKYTGPKHRLARREGVNVLEKQSASLDRKLNIPPGVNGRRGRRKPSEYGIQLREKQKLKKFYGVLEKQFRRYVEEAQRERGNTNESLARLLEARLDNVVYRLGFANSRMQARQYVGHGHIFVNGKKVSIPSYSIKEGDVVTVSDRMKSNPIISAKLAEEVVIPDYMKRTKEKGTFVRRPNLDEVPNPVDYQLVIEFYSR